MWVRVFFRWKQELLRKWSIKTDIKNTDNVLVIGVDFIFINIF